MKVSVLELRNHWKVYFYKPMPEGLPRQISRKFNKKKKNAKTLALDLKREWTRQLKDVGSSGVLPAGTLADVRRAKAVLVDYKGVTLTQAAEFYKLHHTPGIASRNVRDACKGFLLSEKGRGLDPKTYSQYKTRCDSFSESFGDHALDSLTGTEVVEWAAKRGKSPITAWGYLNVAERVIGYAEGQGWLPQPVVLDSHRKQMPLKKKTTAPVILTGKQGPKVFACVPERHRAMFAVLYFTGMRQETGRDIKWRDFDFKSRVIHVPAKADKKGRERFLEGMPERMWEIIEKVGIPPLDQRVVPSPMAYRLLLNTIKRHSGVSPWPANALRRSFASHHLHYKEEAGGQDQLSKTLLIMCHSGSPNVFWNFYYRRSTAEEAQKYFDIPVEK